MKIQGFTLIELLVTLAMIAITLTMGVPAFQHTIHSNQLTTQSNNFIALMNLARHEAIKRGIRVSVCASDQAEAGNAAMTLCTGAWNKGWLVFTDADGNCTLDAGTDTTLRVQGGLSNKTTFSAKTLDTTPANVTCTGFLPSGEITKTNTGIKFVICDSAIKKSREITLNVVGHLSSAVGSC